MAMVYLKNHNENIYNVENEPYYQPYQQQQQMVQQQMAQQQMAQQRMAQQQMQQQNARKNKNQSSSGLYVSKFHEMVLGEAEKRRAGHRTMGYARTPLTPPCNFLKKNEGIRWKNTTDHKCIKKAVPPVPRRGEVKSAPPAPSNKAQQSQDMQKAQENTADTPNKGNKNGNGGKTPEKLVPKRARPKFIDTCYGTSHDLFSSGLMPQYIFRPAYGKVPDYIIERRNQLAAHYNQQNKERYGGTQNMAGPGGAKYISQEERLTLLSGLKANWEKLQKRYQGLPVLTDTEPKKIAKLNLERELKQLEQDIMLLENNPHIYVCDRPK